MKKLASIPLACAVCLLVASAAFAQAPITKNVTVDLNAFASEIQIPNGEVDDVSLNATKIPPSATLSAVVFNFSTFTFAFSSESLAVSEFKFADTNSASVNHTFTTGGLAGENFDLMWTGSGGTFRTTTAQNEDTPDSTFHFSQTADQRAATVTGTINGAQVSTAFANLNSTATQNISIIHP